MDQPDFKPQYPTNFGLVFGIPAVLEAYALWQIFVESDTGIGNIAMAVLFGVMLLVLPDAFIKCITFEADGFTIEKQFGAAQNILYDDVTDIGETMITARGARIGLHTMQNAEELRGIFMKLVAEGKIDALQIEHKLADSEIISRRAIKPALILAFVLSTIAFFMLPHPSNSFATGMIILVFFIPSYFLVYIIMKKRGDRD